MDDLIYDIAEDVSALLEVSSHPFMTTKINDYTVTEGLLLLILLLLVISLIFNFVRRVI